MDVNETWTDQRLNDPTRNYKSNADEKNNIFHRMYKKKPQFILDFQPIGMRILCALDQSNRKMDRWIRDICVGASKNFK
jgi:hypothetical protein